MRKHYSPLRYPGGKNSIFKFVSDIILKNQIKGMSYAEPYAGGAGLALRLLMEKYVKKIYINDLDKSIHAFWTSILNHTDEFCLWIKKVDISIDNWFKYRQIQQNKESVDSFTLAQSTFFLNRTNVSGVIKGGVIGGIKQNGKFKIDARFNKESLISKIIAISKFRDNILVSNLDGLSFIQELNDSAEDVFIYLDPPYYVKGSGLYMNFYSGEDHLNLSNLVKNLDKKWMVSYDNNDNILELYKDQDKVCYKLSQSTSNRVGDEILIFSNKINYFHSLKNLKMPSSPLI